MSNKNKGKAGLKRGPLTIFICTHKPFRPIPQVEARPDIYKIITNCNDPFPPTKLDILRVDKMDCDYPANENMLLNEYRMINAINKMKYKTEYIGICHYRRYYDIDSIERLNCNLVFKEAGIPLLLGQPIVFKDLLGQEYDNETWFAYWHSYSAWQDVKKVFKDFHPELSNEFDEMEKANFLHNSAMMIMPKELFSEWCDFIFPCYEEMKDKLNIHNDTDAFAYVDKYIDQFVKPFNPLYTREYQTRFTAYVLERYLSIWLRIKRENGKSLLEQAGTIPWFMPDPKQIEI